MTAKQLVEKHGKRLEGELVWTEAIGSYPGGVARIVQIYPDPNAPEIAYEVESLNENWMNEDGSRLMGVFGHERAILL